MFNTVPAMILDEEILAVLPHNCLVIDLASKPGGVDERIGGGDKWYTKCK
ncbi:MAG: hypothetical protein RR622_00680 [Hydrogenoanaerobacterium sp.]